MNNSTRIYTGLTLVPQTTTAVSSSGDIRYNTSTNKLEVFNGAVDSVVTETLAATLTNKTLTAPVIATIVNTGTLTLPTSTDTLVGRATTDTLTNKTLTGNTAVNLISGSGTLVLNTTGTITVPNGTDTLAGLTLTQTLTNKTIAAASNTITGLTNTNLSGTAAISNANLASMAANTVKANLTGSPATPTDVATTGTGNVVLSASPTLTGTIAAAALTLTTPLVATSGGTGTGTYTTGDILYASATNTLSKLPIGATATVLTVAAGIPSWAASGSFSVVSKTTTYAASISDGLILCSGSAFTVTLPTAVGNSGAVIRIKKTDSSLTNIITIATTSSQTIDGVTTTTINTQYEEITVCSDGANWQVLARAYPSVWVAYTPTFTGFGTPSSSSFFSRRVGDSIEIHGTFVSGTTTAVTAAISVGYGGTSGNVTIDTGKGNGSTAVGYFQNSNNGTIPVVILTPASQLSTFALGSQGSATPLNPALANAIISNGQRMDIPTTTFPIVGWNT